MTDAAARAAETASVGLILLDETGAVSFLNASAEILLGRSRRKLVGQKLDAAGPIAAAAAGLARRAVDEARDVFAHDLPFAAEGGQIRLSIDAAPEGTGACIAIRRWPETGASPRSDAAANAAAGFGRMLSHELKNPIAGARGAAQLIAQSGDAETAELAGVIVSELDRARRIADRWSRIGDIAPAPFEAVNLHALVRDAVKAAAAHSGEAVAWEEHFDPSIPDAFADRDLVFQALLNLLINATEALDAGGRVSVTTRYRASRPGGPAPDARLEIEVRDDGPGVPDGLKEAIFNPFVTGKPAGEGLGLALVSRIADLHRGGVEFDSRPGETVFRLYLQEAR
ncbi:MAG: ATP-binding protein [Oceanicaulis sp.]